MAHYSEKSWLPILEAQEKLLRFDSFGNEDALAIGMKIIELAKEKYKKAAAIRICIDDTVVFAYKMPGTNSENDWWMDRKRNVSRMTGISSLRACVEIAEGLRVPTWSGREDDFALCGGCMPVFMRDGQSYAFILVSGMHHQEDHQIIADALSDYLGLKIDSVCV